MPYNTENPPRRSGYERMQIPLHLGMGCVYIIFSLLVFYLKYFGTMELSSGLAYALSGLMFLYGIFRLWRGFSMLRQTKRNR